MNDHSRARAWWVAAAIVWACSATILSAQEERYREREVLSPETDTWVEQAAPEKTPDDEIGRARGLLAEGHARQARKLLKKLLKDNPDHERYDEIVYLLGESYFELRNFWKAYEQFENVAENSSGELFKSANERDVDVARAFLAGQKRIVWGFLRMPAYDDGLEILDRVWERVPGTRLGEFALWLRANYFYTHGDMDLAQDEYAHLVQQYPSGRYTQLAMLRSAEAAEAAFPGIRFDARPLLEADERYRQVLESFPAYAEREGVPERLEGIRQLRAEKDLAVAQWYERWRRPDAATFYYRMLIKDWPDTLAAAEARTRLQALGAPVENPESPQTESTAP